MAERPGSGRRAPAWLGCATLLLLSAASPSVAHAPTATPPALLPPSALRVRLPSPGAARWREWWRSTAAPAAWAPSSAALAPLVRWRRVRDGVDRAELLLAGDGEARRTRLVLVRLAPARLRLTLDTAFTDDGAPAWRAPRAPGDAVVALNAGQFVQRLPWGWVVLDGLQFLPPAAGPLVTTVAVDTAGAVRWLHAGRTGDLPPAALRWAFQSFPTLLVDGRVPEPLQAEGGLLDLRHRDARLALGRMSDGRLLVALTRFDGLGERLGFLPLGLTTPEMAAVMGALGARDAVMLDGGISAQLVVRDDAGRTRAWRGLRAVPLGLVARPRRAAR